MRQSYVKVIPVLLALCVVSITFSLQKSGNPALSMETEPPISILVKIPVKPDSIDAFKKALMIVAKASLREPGCFRYETMSDRSDSAVFYIYEVFRDRDAVLSHRETNHFKQWLASSKAMRAGKSEIIRLNTLYPDVSILEDQKSALVRRVKGMI